MRNLIATFKCIHGRTGRKKLGGRKEICLTFSDNARPVSKTFFWRPPPPRRQKIFGQCTILGVQKFFWTNQNFSEDYKKFPDFTKLTEFVPFIFITNQYCPTLK
jgi:hypothetical protein